MLHHNSGLRQPARPSGLSDYLTYTHSLAGFHHLGNQGSLGKQVGESPPLHFWSCGNRRNGLSISPMPFSTARFLHHFPGSSPSHGSTGLGPYIPSSYLSKVWRPIAFSGWVCALIGYELGSPCFLCLKSCE
jgi:hypothetical protein